MVWLLRQGAGRPTQPDTVEALPGTVCHGRQHVDARKRLQQRLHDQLNARYPGLSAPGSQGRALSIESPTGQAVLGCAAAFAGMAPSARSVPARSPGRMTPATAAFWAQRWKRLLAPPPDAELRATRLGRDLRRWQDLQADITACEQQLEVLLAQTPGCSSRRCLESPSFAPRPSRPTRCQSSAGAPPNTCTARPAWRPRPISLRRSTGAARSPAPAWPNTATR
jgi:hypothetical protein